MAAETNQRPVAQQIERNRNVLSATSLLRKSLSQQHSSADSEGEQPLNIGLIRASREMTGNYSCKVSNKLGEQEKQVTVLVYCKYKFSYCIFGFGCSEITLCAF